MSGRMMALNKFMSSPRSIYYTDSIAVRIASYAIKKPLWWALQQLSIVSEEPPDTSWKVVAGDYVIVEVLEVRHSVLQ